ncbi:MAG: outer membrane beta-barrel protein [Bacteroidales bacterium]|jgi:hypothetical protein|nr:outer membrane beta-barrel protein [Bacteroidales bacterium]
MKAKFLNVLVITFLFSYGLMAQDKPMVSILAGPNIQNINGKDSGGDKLDYNLIVGFHAGANVMFSIAPDFWFQPGLLFSTKGASEKDLDVNINISYIELPLNLVYRSQVGNGHVLLGFGPYAALGVGGKVKVNSESYDIKFKNKVTGSNGTGEVYLRPLDAGANIFFGYELSSGLFAQLNAQLGLLKLNPEYEGISDDDGSMKNTGFGVSLGYRF